MPLAGTRLIIPSVYHGSRSPPSSQRTRVRQSNVSADLGYQSHHVLCGDDLPERNQTGSFDIPNIGCCKWNGWVSLLRYLDLKLSLTACLEYFLASWIAVFTIEKFGRRSLMLFGAAGMSFSMVILAVRDQPPRRWRSDHF